MLIPSDGNIIMPPQLPFSHQPAQVFLWGSTLVVLSAIFKNSLGLISTFYSPDRSDSFQDGHVVCFERMKLRRCFLGDSGKEFHFSPVGTDSSFRWWM